MQSLLLPKEIKIKDIIKKKSLSPNNYKIISIQRKQQNLILDYLDAKKPFDKGHDPGSIAYVPKSNIQFLRNSCIDNKDTYFLPNKLIYLSPKYGFENMLQKFDLLMCKDANIGETCLFLSNEEYKDTVFSSGVIKLNFKEEKFKYYCLAFFKDDYFLLQLDARTPKGSTIRHSRDLFMQCKIPSLRKEEEWVYDVFENILKNIVYAEKVCYKKLTVTETIIDSELMTNKIEYKEPQFRRITGEMRIDAGIYSKSVYEVFENIKLYGKGYSTLAEYGFALKRGPNLAKRDLGRSIQIDRYKPNYNILIYPSDISDGGYILETSYIGARNPVWFLSNKNILFSAEGTVGKTFVVCDEELKFTTNFHGMIIYPIDSTTSIDKSIFLGLFLNYLRAKGVMQKLSVGGQGGSFAVGYWDIISIPNFPANVINLLARIYHSKTVLNPIKFDLDEVENAGIFELNNFRIICNTILATIVNDIKQDKLNTKDFYLKSLSLLKK